MPVRDEDWGTESGFAGPAYCDVTITEAIFTYQSAYNQGQTPVLDLTGTFVNGPEGNEAGEFNQWYPCGNGWEPADGGATIVREDGAQGRRVNKSSGYGAFLTAAVECGAGDELQARGNQRMAKVWPGLRFHLEKKKVGEGQFARELLLPTKYLGVAQQGASPPATQEAGEAPSAPVGASSGRNGAGGVTKVVEVKLKKLAKECADHDEFIERAFTMEGLELDAAGEALVSDPDWFAAARA